MRIIRVVSRETALGAENMKTLGAYSTLPRGQEPNSRLCMRRLVAIFGFKLWWPTLGCACIP